MEKYSKKIKKVFIDYWQEIILSFCYFLYLIYFTIASFLRYENFYTGRFDLGNMAQTAWNTIHGNIFMMTDPNGVNEVSRLAFHADFILALLAPFYLIWEDPRMLLLIQTIVLGSGSIFVFLISKEVLKNKTISLIFAICFLLNPAVQYTNLYDFHSVVLATTFLLGAFYFILKQKWWAVILFLFLAGITKEQVWAINAIFGLYIFFICKKRALGALVTAISIIIFYVLIWVLIPKAAGGAHFALEFYSEFGSSPGEVIKNTLLHPIQTINTLLMPAQLDYIKKLFMPLGYFSFLAFPFLIFAAPDLLINLLSSVPQMHQIYYQYSATVTPFIFISGIYAVRFIMKKTAFIPQISLGITILILTILSAYNFGPLPFAKKPNDSWYKKPLVNKLAVNSYINSIPDNAIISASNSLGSHLSHRKQIFVIPQGIDKSNYVLILYENPTDQEKGYFKIIENDPNLVLIYKDNNFYVFKRAGS